MPVLPPERMMKYSQLQKAFAGIMQAQTRISWLARLRTLGSTS